MNLHCFPPLFHLRLVLQSQSAFHCTSLINIICMFALYIVSAIILLADSHCHNVFVLSFVYCPVLFIFFLDCLTAQCTCHAPLSSSSTSLCFHINCGLRHFPFLLPFPDRKMPCGIRRRQTLNRPCVCVHCVYLTNTTIRKATTTTTTITVPQSGSHVVYFDLYPSPLVDPPSFLVCPFLQLKLVKHFILIKLGGPHTAWFIILFI